MSNLEDLQAGRARAGKHSKSVDVLDVAKAQCRTCPWQKNLGILGDDPMGEAMMGQLQIEVLLTSSQICHAPALSGLPETKICRGARNYQIAFFHSLGFIAAPTDEAWACKMQEVQHAESQK